MFLLETWKSAFAFVFSLFLQFDLMEEVFIGVLQAFDGVLERLASWFFEPMVFSFENRQFCFVVLAFERGFVLLVGLDPFTEEMVEDPANAPEVFIQQHFLFSVWFQSELIGIEMLQWSPWDLIYSAISSRITSLTVL